MRLALVVLALLAAACSLATSPSPSPSTEVTPDSADAPSSTDFDPPALDAGVVWTGSEIDPAPGPTVTGGIANALGVPPEDVVAATFLVSHRSARNGVGIYVFRAAELTAGQAGERYVASLQPECNDSAARQLRLAGYDARVAHRLLVDQCQPHYVVLLDEQTVAVLSDDGGYTGNDPSNPPSVPYRPLEEIEALVPWVVEQLEEIELLPGGPPQING